MAIIMARRGLYTSEKRPLLMHSNFAKSGLNSSSWSVRAGIAVAVIVFLNHLGIFDALRLPQLIGRMLSGYDQHLTDGEQLRLFASRVSAGLAYLWWPFVCGFGVTVFTWSMVYLDSDRPGVNPSLPLSPPRKQRYSLRPERSGQLNYMMSVACGVLVAIMTYHTQLMDSQ